MMYTVSHPARQGDRIRLFTSRQEAEAESEAPIMGDDPTVFAVAVSVDAMGRRLIPTWICPQTFDPAWSAPAYVDADGSVTAKAPIPKALFVKTHRLMSMTAMSRLGSGI